MAMMGAMPQMSYTPEMLTAVFTDTRSTPQMRMAAAAQLQAMNGSGGGQPSQQPMAGSGPAPAPDASGGAPEFTAGPMDWLSTGAKAADSGSGAPAPSGGAPPTLTGGTGDLAGMRPDFKEMIRRAYAQSESGDDAPLSSEDKSLALAKAGFGMAASGAHTFGQALGQGAVYGIEGLEKIKRDRAQDRLKSLSLINSAMGTEALIGQRVANTGKTNQTVALTAASIQRPEDIQPIVDYMVETGDVSALARFGAGPAATANKNLAIRMLSEANPDLAAQALSFNQQLSEHKGYGKGMGERAAGPVSYNPSSGTILNPAPAPGPLLAPGGAQRSPMLAPAIAPPRSAAPAIAPPLAAPTSAPAPRAPVQAAPEKEPPIPEAIPFSMPMNPAEKAQEDALATKLGARAEEIDSHGAAATDANYLLNQMRSENKTWDMGKTTPTLMAGKAYLVGFNNLLPDSMKMDDKKMEESVGDYQAFRKNAMELARQTVRATSARAAFQEMQMIQSALPSADMSQPGFDQIAAQLQGANDYRLAQQQVKDMWMKKNKNNLNGFDPWFNKNFNPAVFLLHRLSPEDREKALQTMNQDAAGRAALAKLKNQATYVQNLGLFDVGQ